MRACLREQKSYGLEVLAICNAYTLSLGGVLLINLASSEYYCIYFTRLGVHCIYVSVRYALPNVLCRFTTCRFTTCLLFVFHRRMGTILLLSHTVWGELAFHTLSFTGRAKYEDSISCVTRRAFLFTTSLSVTPVGLAKKDLLLERLDLLLALPSIPLPRYLSTVSTAQSTLHLSCAGL